MTIYSYTAGLGARVPCAHCGLEVQVGETVYVANGQEFCSRACVGHGMLILERPPISRPAPKPKGPKATQKPLFAGLDCLPGQLDLFTTDGEGE